VSGGLEAVDERRGGRRAHPQPGAELHRAERALVHQQLERGDDELPALGQDPDEWAAADALVEGQPTELGESH